jgi:lysyl-tRNA synthetase class 1
MAVRRDALPAEAGDLSPTQRAFLAHLAEELPEAAAAGDAWQAAIFAAASAGGQPPGDAFKALYLAFLGRTSGPRAGWLLASLDRPFVEGRLRAAASEATLDGVRTAS